jgi:ParB family transcriptional regulator, chromosome partitioning protein
MEEGIMSRKNLLKLDDSPAPVLNESREGHENRRVFADLPAGTPQPRGLSAVSKTLRNIEEKSEKIAEYEKRMAEGQVITEVPTDQIDFSFIRDRLDIEASAIDTLKNQIAIHGQQSPVLLRPNPEREGRFQLVYGHRRYLALKSLGKPVLAIIKPISDQEVVIIQGQENSNREDLSFIERCVFGLRIRDLGYSIDVIESSINTDKSNIYRMLKLADTIGLETIQKIGPAPTIGRRRWIETAQLIENNRDLTSQFLDSEEVLSLASDDRFEALTSHLTHSATHPGSEASHSNNSPSEEVALDQTETSIGSSEDAKTSSKTLLSADSSWKSEDKALEVEMKPSAKSFSLKLKKPMALDFGNWLGENIDQLYRQFKDSKMNK